MNHEARSPERLSLRRWRDVRDDWTLASGIIEEWTDVPLTLRDRANVRLILGLGVV